jgi:hypothetical protein
LHVPSSTSSVVLTTRGGNPVGVGEGVVVGVDVGGGEPVGVGVGVVVTVGVAVGGRVPVGVGVGDSALVADQKPALSR